MSLEHLMIVDPAYTQLNGIPVIQAFHMVPHFEKQIQMAIDNQNVSGLYST